MVTTEQLEQLTKDELYDLAKERDIKGRSDMDKAELAAALESVVEEPDEPGQDRPETSSRSIWKGSITFGLITIPIGLYTATEDRSVSFHLLTEDGGSRVRYQRVSEETGEEVGWDDIVKGYEYAKGHYVTFTDEELEEIPADSLRSVDVAQFVPADQIDPISFERAYYVAPEEGGIKAYALLTRALEESDKVGIAKVTLREKEHLCVLRPDQSVLVLQTMKWPDEIRVPVFEQLGDQPEVSPEELQMATQLTDQMSSDYDATGFQDTYRLRLEQAIEAKIEGEEIQLAREPEEPGKVTDLLEALKASVEATQGRRSA